MRRTLMVLSAVLAAAVLTLTAGRDAQAKRAGWINVYQPEQWAEYNADFIFCSGEVSEEFWNYKVHVIVQQGGVTYDETDFTVDEQGWWQGIVFVPTPPEYATFYNVWIGFATENDAQPPATCNTFRTILNYNYGQ